MSMTVVRSAESVARRRRWRRARAARSVRMRSTMNTGSRKQGTSFSSSPATQKLAFSHSQFHLPLPPLPIR